MCHQVLPPDWHSHKFVHSQFPQSQSLHSQSPWPALTPARPGLTRTGFTASGISTLLNRTNFSQFLLLQCFWRLCFFCKGFASNYFLTSGVNWGSEQTTTYQQLEVREVNGNCFQFSFSEAGKQFLNQSGLFPVFFFSQGNLRRKFVKHEEDV